MNQQLKNQSNADGNETQSPGAVDRLCRKLFSPISIAPLVYFRVLYGLLCAHSMYKYFDDGVIKKCYMDPPFHFTYYGFDWVKPLPGDGMYWLFGVLGVAGICIAVGFCYRFAALLFGLGYAYVFLLEQARYLNHYYLVAMLGFMMAAVPAHYAFSVDVWLRPKLKSFTVPAWTVWLLVFQVSVVYFFAGVAKIDRDWLNGTSLSYMMYNRTEVPVVGQFLREKWMIMFLTYGGLVFDLLVVPLLLFRKTRWIGLFVSSMFHGTNIIMFKIGIFPVLMAFGTFILFFSDLLPFPKEQQSKKRGDGDTKSSAAGEYVWNPAKKITASLLVLFVAIQLLLPLRPHVFSGNPSWHEAGHYFAWRMLLRQKMGAPPEFKTAYVKDGKKYQSRIPLFSDRLKTVQEKNMFWSTHWHLRKMNKHPDMIWQFCDMYVQAMRKMGYKEIEVHAFVPVSLNGRPMQYLVDPNVNLAAVPRPSFGPPDWVLPLEVAVGTPRWEREKILNPTTN